MTFLLTPRPNWLLPLFQQTGLVLEYKRFPADYMWRPFLDLSELSFDTTDIDEAIAALEMSVTDLYDLMDLANADILLLYTGLSDANIAIVAAQNDATNALADAAAAQATADAALAAAGGATPKNRRVTMFHDEANVSGGALTLNINAGFINNYASFSTVQGFNAYQSFACDLMPACKLYFIGTKSNASGIMSVYLDGNFVSNLDWYNSTTLLNQIQFISFAANAISAGRHVLRLEVATKNGSSSGYALTLTKYWLLPNTD